MMISETDLPQVFFGGVEQKIPDWRETPDVTPDDDGKRPTPKHVIAMLGFDPALYAEE